MGNGGTDGKARTLIMTAQHEAEVNSVGEETVGGAWVWWCVLYPIIRLVNREKERVAERWSCGHECSQ